MFARHNLDVKFVPFSLVFIALVAMVTPQLTRALSFRNNPKMEMKTISNGKQFLDME